MFFLSALSLLFAFTANAYNTGPTEAELASREQCYGYFEGVEALNLSKSLSPCKTVCPLKDNYPCISPRNVTEVDPSLIFIDTSGHIWTPGTCPCQEDLRTIIVSKTAVPRAQKTVIPDLTAIGYVLTKDNDDNQDKEYFETWDIKYSGRMNVLIDNIGWPNIPGQQPDTVYLPILYNKGDPSDPSHPGDTNPEKVPLRDIILSFWQAKTGRSVTHLNIFWYGSVSEVSALAMVPQAYAAMGLEFNQDLTVVRNGNRAGEQTAFNKLMSTTFAIGLTKLTQEYEEFAARQIEGFQIICDDDDEDSDEDMGITCDPWDLRILF